jgi:CRP-like cAMP-binding protein
VGSSGIFAAHVERVPVLREDPELGAALAPARLALALPASGARVLRHGTGPWDIADDARHARDGLGLLVLEGTLVRRVGFGERFGAELLSAGDLLQPTQHDGDAATVPFSATWRVLAPVRLAVLDLPWVVRMAPFPEVVVELTRRVMLRARRMAALLAIAQHHRLEDRLLLMFWDLADRYGRVGPLGVRLGVRLTHELMSELVGAHRPSVSAAIARLEQAGSIARDRRGWLLLEPPRVAGTAPDGAPPAMTG